METSEPTQQDLYTYGVVAEVKQVPTVMALGVLVDKDLSILCAGGFMAVSYTHLDVYKRQGYANSSHFLGIIFRLFSFMCEENKTEYALN